jgi:type IV pilus assembly protein PilE
MRKKLDGGFTLIELMIVVAIVAILASIAYPAYTSSIIKGRRAQGRTALAELLQQQERFMTQTNGYCLFTNTGGTITATPTSSCSAPVPFKTFSGDNSANSAYYLSASQCSTTLTFKECVLVQADPIQSDLEAGSLQILSTGTKTCTGTKTSVCW